MKAEMKMKNRSHRYDRNTDMDGYKFSKYKNCLIMMMRCLCVAYNICVAYKKKRVIAWRKSKIIFI